ncbi:four helix bundle protein [Candidatus Woesebacteria bacterium]|nr:four helix bundle protein [Candidatus Woesebacteria bacterium]
MAKIKNFYDLIAWQEARSLGVYIYKITDKFPKKEIFGLTSQIRRSAISVSSNIAEGFSRKGKKEKIQFYYHSLGSITELQSQVIIAKDIGYLNKKEMEKILKKTLTVQKLINGLIRGTEKIHNS